MHRYEDEAAGGSFMLGLLSGVVLGAGLGLLLAPRPGAETRKRVSESAARMKEQATDGYSRASEKVAGLVDRGRDTYERARQSVNRGVEEVRRQGQDAAGKASQYASEAADALDDARGRLS